MKIGVIIMLSKTSNIEEEFIKLKNMGISTCQIQCWDRELFADNIADLVNDAVKKHDIEITALWCGWQGPMQWDYYGGPLTLGLVPSAYRYTRVETLISGSDFAKKIGVNNVITHVGFIPENPNDPDYLGVVYAVRFVAEYCKKNGQYFMFETGQETPVTLLRTIKDVELDNLGINFDPANLLIYGKGNPMDALDIIGEYVRGVHVKDGDYPKDGRHLGTEKPHGQGRVNFSVIIEKLKKLGYKGAYTIEREISGEQQIKDIISAKEMLEKLV